LRWCIPGDNVRYRVNVTRADRAESSGDFRAPSMYRFRQASDTDYKDSPAAISAMIRNEPGLLSRYDRRSDIDGRLRGVFNDLDIRTMP